MQYSGGMGVDFGSFILSKLEIYFEFYESILIHEVFYFRIL